LIGYGLGAGFSVTQLTNVILGDIPPAKSGVASGTNTTVRQVGSALGIAVIGTVVTTQTINHAVSAIASTPTLRPTVRASATAQVRALGANYEPPVGLAHHTATTLSHILADSVSTATHDALLFAAAVVFIGGCLSWLIPNTGGRHAVPADPSDQALEEMAEEMSAFVPVDPEAEILDHRAEPVPVAERPS
jgi:hypothetical protein